MKNSNLILIMLFCFSLPIFAQAKDWTELDEVTLSQLSDDDLIFVDFYADWCGPCRLMDKETFTGGEYFNSFIEKNNITKTKIYFDDEINLNELSLRYGLFINAIPAFTILDKKTLLRMVNDLSSVNLEISNQLSRSDRKKEQFSITKEVRSIVKENKYFKNIDVARGAYSGDYSTTLKVESLMKSFLNK